MKKLYLLILLVVPALTGFAQDRTCATMTSLEERMEKDPSLRKVHEDYERATQEWIKAHTVPQATSVIPLIPGYTPTGNREVDQQRYASAKAALIRSKNQNKQESVTTPAPNSEVQKEQEKKKKTTTGFVYGREGGSK